MSTFTIRVTTPGANTAGTAYGQSPDLNAPSFFDMVVTGSSDPNLPNGVYDAYCLNPFSTIYLSPTTYSAEALAGSTAASFAPAGVTTGGQTQLDQINWLLAQNFTSDAKFGGQFNFGEVQTAIWKLQGYTDAQITSAGYDRFLNDNNRQVVSADDANFLVTSAQSAVASGHGVLPQDTFFSTIIDPAGNAQPLIVQLQTAKLGDFVWLDTNANGVQDAGEVGVDNVVVQLLDGNGKVLATTTTGDDFSTAAVEHGFYQFAGLAAGSYQVKFIAPTDYSFTTQDVANNGQDSVDSDANSSGLSQLVVLAAGASNQTIDAGLLAPVPASAKISGYVYEDAGNDGVRNNEPGIAGVTVYLNGTDSTGASVTLSTTTNAGGLYEFTGLKAGSYTVTETQPDGYLDGKETAGTGGTSQSVPSNDTIAVTVGAGQTSAGNNFGELKAASLAGNVFYDANNDGARTGDAGIGGVVVTLTGTTDTGAAVTLSTTTAGDGSYKFDNLRPGTYSVTEGAVPAIYIDGKDTAGTVGGLTTGTAGNDVINTVTLKAGDASIENNFGEIKPAAISGVVYDDKNNDGSNAGDSGIPGVLVTVTGTNDLNQTVTFSTTTGADGSYSFEGLRPGSYTVTETQPGGFLDGKETAGNGATIPANTNDTIAVTLTPGQTSAGNNFGELKLASLAGNVFYDANNDGARTGEAGIGGVLITLTGTNDQGAVTLSTTTAPDGSYKFDLLRPGTYTVTEGAVPAIYIDGKDTAGTVGGLTTGTAGNDVINTVTLKAGDASIENNFGEIKPAAISGVVYDDKNNDGSNAGDSGIQGVLVTVTGTNDLGATVTLSTTTGPDGSYSFEGLRPGSYTVTETQPSGFLDGKETAGNGATIPANTNDTIAVTLTPGQTSAGNNFGELKPACILGVVYEDKNNDGVQGPGELGIPGVTVTVTGTNDLGQTITVNTTTGADGSYKFDTLRPGTYTVTETQPAGYLDGKDSAGNSGGVLSNDKVSTIVLTPGAAPSGVNFGEVKASSLAGVVFEDTNNDGTQNGTEKGIPGATVTLSGTDDLGNPVSLVTTTGADGSYKFDTLRPGTYTVTETQPAGYLDGKDTVGTTGGTLSNDKISAITLPAGVDSVNNNFGELKAASVAGVVYEDKNNDGVQNGTESGIPGATVKLTGTDDLGNPVSLVTTTGADGSYKFDTLRPGTYTVTETQPAGYLDGKDTVGTTGGTLSNDKISAITLPAGVDSVNNNFGELKAASVAGNVFFDANNDGSRSGDVGIAGVLVTLTGANDLGAVTLSTTTAPDGSYKFDLLRPGTYSVTEGAVPTTYIDGKDTAGTVGGLTNGTAGNDVINTVTLKAGDASIENNFGEIKPANLSGYVYHDANNDGLRTGEQGILGAVVTLTGTNDLGQPVTFSTTTDANGLYNFTNLRPGTYSLVETQPATYLDGKDTIGTQGGTAGNDTFTKIILGAGATGTENNFGELKTAAIGDRVWFDANGNGVQDGTEGGKSGVLVYLLDANGNQIASQTTDANGNYLFDKLIPGKYAVQFTEPLGFDLTTKDASNNTLDATDSDADQVTGKTGFYTLASGETNLTVDAGLVNCTIKLGDRVWFDLNRNGIQDGGELGMGGVKVTLVSAGADGVLGTADDTSRVTTTDGSGNYLFDGVTFGTYKVVVDVPKSYLVTLANVGDDALDSDIVAKVTYGTTNLIVNGSFELPSAVASGSVFYSSISGWTGQGDTIEVGKASTYGVTGATGNNVVELDANKTGSCNIGTGLYQDVQTTAGQTYQLSVDLAARSGTATATNTVEIWWAGCKIATIDPTSTALTTYTFNVTGTGGANRLEFREQLGDDDCVGGIIDNVKLVTCTTTYETAPIIVNACTDNLTIDAGLYSANKLGIDVQKYVSSSSCITPVNCGGQGSSVDYWKSNCKWESSLNDYGWSGTGCKSTLTFNQLFGVNCAGGTQTIYQVLCGTGTGMAAAMRECVAAYLNACHNNINYAFTKDQVCAETKRCFTAASYDEICKTFNTENCQGGSPREGASVDYWKTHCKWDASVGDNGWIGTGCKASASFNSVFGVNCANGTKSIYDILCGTSTAAADVTMRHCVAAYLNACHDGVDYAYTKDQVCAQTKSCFTTLAYNTTCDLFSAQNNLGCHFSEGASVDYWKSHCTFDSSLGCNTWTGTGCTTKISFNQLFGVNCSGGEKSLQDILCATGTGLTALMREAAAGYLNACHTNVNYCYTKDQVCSLFRSALSCANYDDTWNNFCKQNNQGCDFTSCKQTYNSCVDTQLYDADAPPGLEVAIGSTVTFTYIVKNTGDTALKDIALTDDRITDVTYVSGDTNGNKQLDVGESWVYTAKELAAAGTIKNIGTVIGTDTVGGIAKVTASDAAYYTGSVKNTGSIGDRVWYDKNANGLQDTGEVGVANVKVTLKGAGADGAFGTADDITATTTTSSTGAYQFNSLAAGKYTVVVDGQAGYAFTKANQGSNDSIDSDVDKTGTTGVITLADGQQNLTVDAGIAKVGIDVQKYVSGSQTVTSNSCGGEGATVDYWKSHCGSTSSTAWVWTSWFSGFWQTTYTPTAWAGVTQCKASDSFNSVFGVNCTNGTKSVYDVLCGTSTATQDVWMRECVAAYLNACHDKVNYQYSTDQVCADVKYALSCGNYDDICKAFSHENNQGCGFTNVKSCWNTCVDTQLYDADAPPGLQVQTGSTVTFTYIVKNTGDTSLANVNLTDDRIANVKYISGDANANGLLDVGESWTYTAQEVASAGTIKNIGTVTAVDAIGQTVATTASDPAYYTGVGPSAAKGSIGDRVWLDKNYNGIQDAGEAGLCGIKVTLKGAGADGVWGTKDDITATTTTNSAGNYEFNNLDAGKYQVIVDKTGYYVTKQLAAGSTTANDSDIDGTGTTAVITLGAGEHKLTVDAGLYQKACVGDKVWEDKNHNGLQDVGESGIGNVVVKLLDSTGAVLQSTTTNSNGNYQFSNIDPGSYALQFDKSNVIYNGVNMNAWKWGVKNVGTNDAIDSDVNGDGVSTTNVTKTDLFTLTSGQSDQTRDATITPIVIDLNGDGIHTISRAASTGSFDLFGNGTAIKSGWISGSDGFLAIDKNGNGKVDDISELFGGNAKGAGFAQLAAYDSNGDGLVDAKDAHFADLRVWQDVNGNHQTDAGELMTLAQAGVSSLTVAHTDLPFVDAQDNLHLERSTATMASGASVSMTDVYFNVSADDAKAAGVALPTIADLLGNDTSLDKVLGAPTAVPAAAAAAPDAAAGHCGGDASEVLRKLAALTSQTACHGSSAS